MKIIIILFTVLTTIGAASCGNANKPVADQMNEQAIKDSIKEAIMDSRQNAIRDSISENYALACENDGNLFFFKGKPQHYKRFLYIYHLDAEKCDSLKDAFPIIFDFYTTHDNRIVMIEHDPNAGEGSLGAFASTAPKFYVDEYNTETGKIRCLVNGCTSAEFVHKNSSNRECSLKIGNLVVKNPDACSADLDWDIQYKTIALERTTSEYGKQRPSVDPFEAAYDDNETLKQLNNARILYKDFQESLTIDEMVDMSFIFWEFGNKREKEIAVALMKSAVKKDKKHVQERIYHQSEIGWGMPGTPEYPEGLPQP